MKGARVRHALEYGLYLPFAGLLRALPHAASRRLGRELGRVAWATQPAVRRVARENLAFALPELAAEHARIVRDCFLHVGEIFADAISSARFDLPEFCRRGTVLGLEHLLAAESAGRGIVLVTLHYGAWEALPFYITLGSGPTAMLGRPPDNPHMDRVVRELRERWGNRMFNKRGSVRELYRIVLDHGRVGLLIDQRVRAEEAIDVPFLGRPALTSALVAWLSLKSGAPIVPVFCELAPAGRYRVEFLPPLVEQGPADAATAFAITRRIHEICEPIVRAAPEKWLWLHERWKH